MDQPKHLMHMCFAAWADPRLTKTIPLASYGTARSLSHFSHSSHSSHDSPSATGYWYACLMCMHVRLFPCVRGCVGVQADVRGVITGEFEKYAGVMRGTMNGGEGQEHWAKLELPEGGWEREEVIERIRTKYPVMEIVRCRRRLDPHNILGNPTLDVLFPTGAKPKSHA